MDALALLCNLHAEGPRTLQRLRRIGCATLLDLVQAEPNRIAQELDTDPDGALRFQREAELLSQRLLRDRAEEEATDEATALEEPAPAVPAAPPAAPRSETAIAGIDAVLDTWRTLDDNEPPGAPTSYEVPRPAAGSEVVEGLRESTLPGLTADLIARLGEAGVRSLSALVDEDTLELSRRVEKSFTALRRLQYLAVRRLEETERERATARAASPFTVERRLGDSDPGRLESAGPFA